ncbi:MAG: DUF3347 domain-containing protein [Ferruginibacter sp.]
MSFGITALLATVFIQNSFAQDSTQHIPPQLSQLLVSYYNIKDALVAGNADLASTSAEQYFKIANGIDYKVISEANINALLKVGGKIPETRDIREQRELFSNLSANMLLLSKAIKFTPQPVYKVYCPMKKAFWLSSYKAIKNPYFGSAMLTCGKVVDTLQ